MVEDAQLSPQVVASTQTHTRFEHSTFRSKGKCPNQYTIATPIYLPEDDDEACW